MMLQISGALSMKFSPVLLGALFGSAAAAILFGAGWLPSRVNAGPVSGEAIYKEYCASCHDHPGPRIPPRSALQNLSVARILRTLDIGVMMKVAYGLQRSQRVLFQSAVFVAGEFHAELDGVESVLFEHAFSVRGASLADRAADPQPQAQVGFRICGRHHRVRRAHDSE